ncbi:quinone oxidoreductase family protein [Bowmanella pacifica]|uniref:NADPH:quinone reductase n=1 Tax=Bowmanella pacifica TaxID=502051 RepID=A0A917YTL3_9ALTE|nr:quinone oxidoreductase [Bowmanella pacifica]GGO65996.1 quinone oxidoreductase [Bowmanella pacifica]
MTQQIQISQTGGPDVMQLVNQDPGAPGPGEVRLRQHAIGLNYIDVYFRTGLYPQSLPGGLGLEGAGEIEAVGEGVEFLKPGDRVAYAGGPTGAYAQIRVMPAAPLVKIPDDINFETAAAIMLKGLTVQYLLRRTFRVQTGQTILFHAAAGGVGLLACQWANALGVRMIGTVGDAHKSELAKANGCAEVINYNKESFVDRVRELTNGEGVPVVYDSVGKSTFQDSLDCLSPLGMMVSFGNASGAVPEFALSELTRRGSLFITRPRLFDYVAKRQDLESMSQELFAMVQQGKLQPLIGQRYALADAAQAHKDLEARKLTGSAILLP